MRALLVAAFVLAGCVGPAAELPVQTTRTFPPPSESTGAWSISACAFVEPSSGRAPPDLVAAFREWPGELGGRLMRLSPSDGSYHVSHRSTVWSNERFFVESAGSDLYAHGEALPSEGQGPELFRLDGSLSIVARKPMEAPGALIAHGDGLLLADESLRAVGPDLAERGRIDLPLKEGGWTGKSVHAGVVHDDVAYLLDDVVVPLFILRVDVADATDMRVLERHRLEGGHLPGHWVDPARGWWVVENQWGGMGGGSTRLHAFPMEGGGEAASMTSFSSSFALGDSANATSEGFGIAAALDIAPVWALARDAEGMRLGMLDADVEAGRIAFCEVPIELEPGESRSAGIERSGAFVVAWSGRQLVVIEERPEGPALVAAEMLPAEPMGLRAIS